MAFLGRRDVAFLKDYFISVLTIAAALAQSCEDFFGCKKATFSGLGHFPQGAMLYDVNGWRNRMNEDGQLCSKSKQG